MLYKPYQILITKNLTYYIFVCTLYVLLLHKNPYINNVVTFHKILD